MSDINVQTFSGKVNISNNLKVGQGHLFVDTLNNQVGLNTNTPLANLHVNGNTFVNTDLRVGSKVLVNSGAADSNVIVVTGGNIKAEFLHGDGSNIANISADNIDGTLSQWTGEVGSSIYYTSNVGIGTTNPLHTLDVHGDANVGVLTATFLHGDGSNIANIVSSQWEGSPGDPIYYDGNVGIATTTAPTRTLEVGSNLYVEDTGSNVLVVDGNVAATSITIGDATIVASQGLDHVTNENNTTTQVVQFNNPTTGFVTASNAVIGGTLSLQNFELSQSYGLENVTNVNNTTEDTIISSNATTGFQSSANVSVGRDALVTGNVTVGKDLTVSEEAAFSSNVTIAKDLEVSGNVTNLDVLSNVNLLSVSNVVSIRKDSNVVTEFSRSKKLIKYPREAIPGNNSAVGSGYTFSASDGDYTIKVSSEYDHRFYASNAFDNNLSTYAWLSADSVAGFRYTSGNPITSDSLASSTFAKFGEYGEWIELKLPTSIYLGYVLVYPKDNRVNYLNTSAIVWGSNTGNDGDWKRLSTFTSFGNYTESNPAKIVIDSLISYNYYAYQITGINSTTTSQFSVVSELELFGVPEYDPDAAGVDVKVTSYPNVPNTDWLEVYYDAKDLTGVPSTVLDLSGNSRNGTLNGGVSVSDGAFVFNGTSDIRSTVSTFTGDQPHTMSVWVNISTSHTLSDGYICVLAPSTGENLNQVSTIRYQNDGFNLQSWGNDIQMYNIGVEKGRWYHLVAVYDGGGVTTSSKRLYINTVQNTRISGDTTTGDEIDFANTTLSLGSRVDGTGSHLTGSIANFRLFNRALTTDEVWQLYAYQKEYFGHGDLSMTLKAGRLGIGTSEPRAALDVRGAINLAGKIESPFFKVFHIFNKQSAVSTGWSTNYSGTVYAGSTVVVICNASGFVSSGGYATWTLQYSTDGSTYTTLDTFKQYYNTTSDHEEQSRTFVWTPTTDVNFTNWKMTFNGSTDEGDNLDLVLIALPV